MGKSQVVRILIVDDEADLREILSEQLQKLEFQIDGTTYRPEIHQAENGKDAIAKTESQWFDAILSDINMPEMTGIELLAALRGAGSDVPVVILTGYGDKAKSVEALRLGCYAFLDKPWKADYLRRVMTGAAEQGVLMRARAEQVESQVATYDGVPEPRRRQLRNVFRSMFTGGESAHRSDVCEVPTVDKKKVV